jgi:type IX secretion system PorP/SprF family membrane protein
MKKRLLPLIIVATLLTTGATAQQTMLYNHYYLNPFLYNPSYIAPSGYSELYLNYRKQWNGISGAPTTGTLNVHVPLNYKAGVAFTAFQDEAGLLKTTTGLVSFAYSIHFGKRITDINKLTFGLSAGMTNSRVDSEKADDQLDPVIGNSTSSLDGQFGFHYRLNNLRIGFAIPRIFDTRVVSEKNFSGTGIAQLNNTISSVSYDFRLTERFSFEPMFTYRTYQDLDPHFEAMGTFKVSNLAWIGGAYRQNYGAFTHFGVNIKQKLKVAYAYEFATDQTDRIGNGSHEVQISYRLGKTQHTRQHDLAQHKPAPTHHEQAKPHETHPVKPAEHHEEKPVEKNHNIDPVPSEPVHQEPQPQHEETKAPVHEPVLPEHQHDTTGTVKNQPTHEHTHDNDVAPFTNLEGEGLPHGHYVVVGAFHSLQNAKNYMNTLKKAGYPANVAYDPLKHYYIIHMDQPADDLEHARELRDKYRQMSRYSFRDTWILIIE